MKFNTAVLQSIIVFIISLILANYLSTMLIALILLITLWGFASALEQIPRPNTTVGNLLAVATSFVLFVDVGLSDTVNLFVSMLLVSVALKQLIATSNKHLKIIALVHTFVIASVFLYQQNLMFSLVSLVLITLELTALNMLGQTKNIHLVKSLKLAAVSVISCLPITLLCFLLIPKLPSFWALPGPSTASTGLNETVNPFDIAKLSQSSDLVFRATFNDSPPTTPMYWRAMIHEQYSDRGWTLMEHTASKQVPTPPTEAQALGYEIIAEKSSLPWLYALDYGHSSTSGIINRYDGILARTSNLSQTIKYQAQSSPLFDSLPSLNTWSRMINLSINRLDNNQSQLLAKQLKRQARTDAHFFQMLMDYYASQGFVYTLSPPALRGLNTIDQFMVDSKQGFCGHYASSAAFIFRSAGIPARVVSGYLGGEKVAGGYFNIYQYDAHAWTEVWLAGKGWTIFDATAVIAPDRLLGSLSESDSQRDAFMNNLELSWLSLQHYPMINWLRTNIDQLDFMWTTWVLGYDNSTQASFLQDTLGDISPFTIAITVLGTIGLVFLSYFGLVYWQNRPVYLTPLAKEYQQLQQWAFVNATPIEANDLTLKGTTPLKILSLISEQHPNKGQYIKEFAAVYSSVRYQDKTLSKSQRHNVTKLIKTITKK